MNNAKPLQVDRPSPDRPVADEWGMYDVEQAGMPAAIRMVRERLNQSAAVESPSAPAAAPAPVVLAPPAPAAPPAPVATHPAPGAATQSPVPAPSARPTPVPAPREAVAQREAIAPREVRTSHADHQPITANGSRKSQAGAVYSLEYPTKCPHCEQEIQTFRVFRLMRVQASFTSTLPRKGYVIVCPECDHLISSELSGLI